MEGDAEKEGARPLKVSGKSVRDGIGFFWEGRCKMYVAATPEDVEKWRTCHCGNAELHPMSELERAFKESGALRFISWCDASRRAGTSGCIVPQGVCRATFEYATHKSVVHIK